MKDFLQKYNKDVTGAISGWARIAWRGTIRWLEDPCRAQELLDEQLKTDWADMLEEKRKRYFGVVDSLFKNYPLDYYWSTDETELATDAKRDCRFTPQGAGKQKKQ